MEKNKQNLHQVKSSPSMGKFQNAAKLSQDMINNNKSSQYKRHVKKNVIRKGEMYIEEGEEG